jgi:basic membrane protein A
MKIRHLLLTTALLVSGLAVPVRTHAAPLRVFNVVDGTLGDKGFLDSAQSGMERAQKELGITFKTIELTNDPTRWEPGLDDAIADVDNYDILITGTFPMAQYMTTLADKYPDKKFIVYDTAVDYSQCKCTNVYSVVYAQNEGSYLAGVYAAAMLRDGKLGNVSGKHTLAAIGGDDTPIINDFMVGYEQGALSVDPQIQVLKQYVGGTQPYSDPAKAKEEALALYDQGADILFGIAGESSLGVIDAAKDRQKYAIGVDADQATILGSTDPKAAAQILTSMEKNVGASLYRAIDLAIKGTLPYGTVETIGLADGAVGLAHNTIYNKMTPDSVKQLVDQAQADIIACKIIVKTAFDHPRPCVVPATLAATAAK